MSPEPTATCPICTVEFPLSPYGRDRHTYCSRRCRELARQQRDQERDAAAQARLAAGANPAITLGTRTTVKQPTNTHISAPATGQALEPAATRPCPHCGEAITIVALLTTPEAARPTIPPTGDVIPIRRA